jgi:uncharacterized lipoprotein
MCFASGMNVLPKAPARALVVSILAVAGLAACDEKKPEAKPTSSAAAATAAPRPTAAPAKTATSGGW